MSTITREHLELAALAAGHKVYGWCVGDGGITYYADIGPDESISWRPHLDDGDAARLAVRLRLTTEFEADDGPGDVGVYCYRDGRVLCRAETWHDGTETDKLRAWRARGIIAPTVKRSRRAGGSRLPSTTKPRPQLCAGAFHLVDCQGVEPRRPKATDLQSAAVANAARNPVVAVTGLEPVTCGL
jgi:hypothetical protein